MTPGKEIHPVQALLFGLGAIVLFWSARPILSPFGLGGVGLLQWFFLALPVVAGVTMSGGAFAQTLGFRRVPWGVLVGGALIMVGALPFNGVVAWLQSFVLEVPVETLQAMAEQLVPRTVGEWVLALMVVSVTPAFCEEIVFRGILMNPFRDRVPAVVVIAVTSLAFGAMHWMPGTAFRVLPAAFSGAVIGTMVWKTGSLWTGVFMHLVNNALLLSAAAVVPDTMPEDPSLTPNPLGLLVGIVLVIGGARVVAMSHQSDRAPSEV